MNFPTAVRTCFCKWWDTGRASRSEFWYWQLFTSIASIPFDSADERIYHSEIIGPFGVAFTVATLLPSVFVSVRRLHDVNRSYWWLFLGMTGIGLIPLLYWFMKRGDAGNNRFGPNPLAQ